MDSVAESLAEFIEDMQLKVHNDEYSIIMLNNSENMTNLKDWLLETEANVKIEYSEYIKLTLS